jgi:hypothetical protein
VQGILDVGMTQEDHVELVKTHTFVRKHATGTAKIELHVLQVERGRRHDFLSFWMRKKSFLIGQRRSRKMNLK